MNVPHVSGPHVLGQRKRARSDPSAETHWSTAVYRPLEKNPPQIRRLLLLPTKNIEYEPVGYLWPYTLDDNDADILMTAISYVWGDPADTAYMTLNNCRIKIGKNAQAALRSQCHGTRLSLVWIDAVCINQQDLKERGEQVKLMKYIYRNATSTMLWLGEGEVTTGDLEVLRDVMRITRERPKTDGGSGWIRDGISEKHWASITRLLQHSFWRRLWIVQETALSTQRDRAWLWTSRSRSIRFIWLMANLTVIYGTLINTRTVEMEKWKTEPSTLWHVVQPSFSIAITLLAEVHFWFFSTADPADTLEFAAIHNRNLTVTDPRDWVYALLGLLKINGIEPDYTKSVRQVFQEATFAMVKETRSLRILLFAPGLSHGDPAWPSWVVDWRIPSHHRVFDTTYMRYRACIGHAANLHDCSEGLTLSACRLFRIHQVSSMAVFPRGSVETSVAEFDSTLADIYKEARRIFHTGPDCVYKSMEAFKDAFVRTLVFDTNPDFRGTNFKRLDPATDVPEKISAMLDGALRNLVSDVMPSSPKDERSQNGSGGSGSTPLVLNSMERSNAWFFEIKSSIEYMWHNKRLASTPDERMCVVPEATRPGDAVFVLSGGEMPLILRPCGHGSSDKFRLVGSAYVDKMMDGEAIMDSSKRLSTGDPDAYDNAFSETVRFD